MPANIKSKSDCHLIEPGNGLRIIYRKSDKSDIVYCGFLIGAGSRDEEHKKSGVAHFIEHAVFKGTRNRNALQVLNRLESVGGEVNAYTSREKTCFYSTSLKKYLERSIDLLSDIVFYPIFPELELEREKRVILEEIEMYEDSPMEKIYDTFHNLVYKGHSIGHSILGTNSEVRGIDKDDIYNFRNKNYSNDQIVLSIVGNLTLKKVESLVGKYLEKLPIKSSAPKNGIKFKYKPFTKEVEKDFKQVHCILGNIAYSQKDTKKYGLMLINNVLGGDWMSSRLNISIREKYGYAYNISSHYSAYSDTGLFLVQFGTDLKYLNKIIKLVLKEFKLFREKKLSKAQLNKAKRQLYGMYTMAEENKSIMMQVQASNTLDYNRVISKQEFLENIDRITSDDLLEIANEVMEGSKLSTLIYKNK